MSVKFVDAVDLGGNPITNVATPTDDSDAASKSYVDSAISDVSGGGLTTENVQDIVGTMVATASSTVEFTYDDPDGTLSAAVLDSPTVQGHDAAYLLARANQTGTQTASTISDFDTGVTSVVDGLSIDAATLGGSSASDLQTTITAAIVASAPSTLDTLNELASALGDDADFSTTVTTALAARVQQYDTSVGNGTDTSFTVTHNLACKFPTVAVWDTGTLQRVWTSETTSSDGNSIVVTFAAAPAANAYRVVVQGRAD